MTSNKQEIKYMLIQLNMMNLELGNTKSKKQYPGSEFDALQQQFLTKRHHVDRLQDAIEKEGTNSKTAKYGYEIRQGISQMQKILEKLKEQHRKLQKKKKQAPQILTKKSKIVQNCELLLADIEDRQNVDYNLKNYKPKTTTLTDMKARLLNEINENTEEIHQQFSDGALSQMNEEEYQALQKFKNHAKEEDEILDDIIVGIDVIRAKVKDFNIKQDQIQDKIKKNSKAITKTTNNIDTSNKKLKKIIQAFKPSSCCLGLVLFLLFVGLIVVIIKLLV